MLIHIHVLGIEYTFYLKRKPQFIKTLNLEIVETDPGLKGDTAGTGGKPATLSTGAVVRVPLFVQTGEMIKVDTRNSTYASRVKD